MIEKRVYDAPQLCRQEILRYAGVKEAAPATEALLEECLREAKEKLTYRVCFRMISIEECAAMFPSGALQNTLVGCSSVLVFAATVGADLDRLIARYGSISPAKAHMLQAIGAERIEALCDTFCRDMQVSTHRFSPGYGDLPLTAQKEIFALLEPMKHIGLGLTGSLLMAPTKSVTALAGMGGKALAPTDKCSRCGKLDCDFRSTL